MTGTRSAREDAGGIADPAAALGSFAASINVGASLAAAAARAPERAAVIEPARGVLGGTRWRTTSARELDLRCDAFAHALVRRGVLRGDRVAVFVPPGRDFVALAFALLKIGAVPVLIDPGIGVPALVRCIAKAAPRAFVAVAAAQVLRAAHAREMPSIEIAVTVGRRWLPGAKGLDARARGPFEPAPTRADETAAILFTSGATGPPKGVVYTHAMLEAQIRALRTLYGLEEGEIDLACFPLFALIDAALGITSVFPPLDPARPARADPARIVAAIEAHAPTLAFGSPAIWRRVVPWCVARGESLPSLRRVMIAGAPVALDLVAGFESLLGPGADVHTPYGATECLPLASIAGRELLGPAALMTESGAGTCVGRAAPGVELALIAIGDAPVAGGAGRAAFARVARGELGEICARGPVVTHAYVSDPEENARAKIEVDGDVWHRTGDVGWLDADRRLWFCGRKAHRLETAEGLVTPVPTENVFNLHPRVARTALVGLGARGSERACLVVEPKPGRMPATPDARRAFVLELHEVLRSNVSRAFPPRIAAVETVLFHESFPVDPRHNAKIRREELKRWAESQRP